MSKWENKSTNDIVLDIINIKEKHEAIKRDIAKLLDEMEEIEKDFVEANKTINSRLGKDVK